jgi:hypothetical protein
VSTSDFISTGAMVILALAALDIALQVRLTRRRLDRLGSEGSRPPGLLDRAELAWPIPPGGHTAPNRSQLDMFGPHSRPSIGAFAGPHSRPSVTGELDDPWEITSGRMFNPDRAGEYDEGLEFGLSPYAVTSVGGTGSWATMPLPHMPAPSPTPTPPPHAPTPMPTPSPTPTPTMVPPKKPATSIAAATDPGFAVWSFQKTRWVVELNNCGAGYEPGAPPAQPGEYEGQCARTHGVKAGV